MRLDVLPGRYAVHRFPPDAPWPVLPRDAPFVATARTAHELSIVAPETWKCDCERCEGGWGALAVAGPIPFDEVGVLADLSQTIAGAGLSLFVVSTFDTDIVLVKIPDLGLAIDALRRRGHEVGSPDRSEPQ